MIAPPVSSPKTPAPSGASPQKTPKIKRVRVRTPPVLQMESVECGAAALSIVMAHFGRRVPLEEMRIACGVSRDGSKASNIVKAARAYGMDAKGFRKEPHELREMPLPLIAFWQFNHFLVVEGWNARGVYLNDPAMGPRFVTHDEFDTGFTGIALVCRPGEGWQKGGEKSHFLHALSTRLKGSGGALWFVVLAGLGLVLPGLALPIFSKIFVDNVLVSGLQSWVAPLLVGLLITAVLRAMLTALQQRALLRLETKLSVAASSRFFWHLLQLPVEFYTQRSAGEIAQRVAINDRIASLLSGQLATNALGIVTAIFFLFLMARYDIVLTAVALGSAALNIAALAWVSKKRALENQKLLMETGKVMGTTVTGLQLIESLKAGGLESDFFARWAGFQAKASNAEARLGVMTRALGVVPPLLAALNTALVLGVGGVRVMNGDISVGTLVAFQTLTVSFLDPVNRLVALASSLQEAQGDMQRIDDVLRYPQRTSSTRYTQSAPPVGHIELRDVTFGYSRLEAPLIEDFNLSLKPGSRVALVGGSGSGKTTIVRLVCGLNQPWNGAILFDDQPRDSWPDHIWSSAFSVVDQEIFLFSGSVRDNLTLWDDTVPEADMVQAARDACIHDAIVARPGGYNSLLGEGGHNFSGGQRQRLEIARALVTNPAIVVLDEATSALDAVTEKTIDDNLRRRGCTCLIIAHRLSTIRDCDEIVVLENGKVVQRGTHETMMRESGPYKTLISAE